MVVVGIEDHYVILVTDYGFDARKEGRKAVLPHSNRCLGGHNVGSGGKSVVVVSVLGDCPDPYLSSSAFKERYHIPTCMPSSAYAAQLLLLYSGFMGKWDTQYYPTWTPRRPPEHRLMQDWLKRCPLDQH